MGKNGLIILGVVIMLATLLFVPMHNFWTGNFDTMWVTGMVIGAIVFLIGITRKDEKD